MNHRFNLLISAVSAALLFMAVELLHIDCMEYMAGLPDKAFDVCITDPPYGNNLDYKSYDDAPEKTKYFIKQFMPEILRVSKRAIITSGVKLMYEYPKPDWVGCWFSPAGVGLGPHGFCTWQPILIYGKDPNSGKGSYPDGFNWMGATDAGTNFHPCPKPIKLWAKLFKRWIGPKDEKIFDPFLGSGSSAIAAHKLGFNFVGCEIDKDYYDAAVKRYKKETAMPLFD